MSRLLAGLRVREPPLAVSIAAHQKASGGQALKSSGVTDRMANPPPATMEPLDATVFDTRPP
jgi:hypothetical protein